MPSYEHVLIPPVPTTEFSDVYEEGGSIILIDLAHDNAFDKEELNVLILRLVSRDLTIKFFDAGNDLKMELLGKGEEEGDLEGELLGKEEDLEEELTVPDASIVVCPRLEFSKEERESVGEFVSNGGKLLLIADPTRYGEMNSLSLDFSLLSEPNFLYNMRENETNYRNIFAAEFKDNEITKELEKIALHIASSISSADSGITFVDEHTFSSMVGTRTRLSPVALTEEFTVLTLYDPTFMTEPHNGIVDNNQLISNMANCLASPTEKEAQ